MFSLQTYKVRPTPVMHITNIQGQDSLNVFEHPNQTHVDSWDANL